MCVLFFFIECMSFFFILKLQIRKKNNGDEKSISVRKIFSKQYLRDTRTLLGRRWTHYYCILKLFARIGVGRRRKKGQGGSDRKREGLKS